MWKETNQVNEDVFAFEIWWEGDEIQQLLWQYYIVQEIGKQGKC